MLEKNSQPFYGARDKYCMKNVSPSMVQQIAANPGCGQSTLIASTNFSEIHKIEVGDGLRVVKIANSNDNRKLLRNEATSLNHIGPHPNIVSCYNIVDDPNDTYIELEHLDEKYFCQTGLSFPIQHDGIMKIAKGISKALCHIHGKGYRHNDIKPENIWFGEPAKLIDFGSASKADEDLSIVAGTLEYMSPFLSDPSMPYKNDIFAFGLSIYEMCTGKNPFCNARKWANWGNEILMAAWYSSYERLLRSLKEEPLPPPLERLVPSLVVVGEDGIMNGRSARLFIDELRS